MLTGGVECSTAVWTCYCGMDDIEAFQCFWWCFLFFFISLSEKYRTQAIQIAIADLSLQGNEISVCLYFFFFLHMSIHFYGRHGLKIQYSARR